jgi:predicted ArsR family transcriptional regulator
MTGETDPARSTVQSVRQAIRRLAEAGAIETAPVYGSAQGRPDTIRAFDRQGRRRRFPHQYPPPGRLMLGARLTLTDEERSARVRSLDAMRAR